MMEKDHDPSDPAGQERALATVAEEERLQREKEVNDLIFVMGTKQGRRFIHRQLSRAGIWLSSFNVNNALMSFNEGRRNQGLELLNDLMEACPDRYTLMLDEHREEKERHEHRTADRRNKRK